MKTIVNLCPHPLQVQNTSGQIVTIPPTGIVMRVSTAKINVGTVETDAGSFTLRRSSFGQIEVIEGQKTCEAFGNDPYAFDENSLYVVSSLVLDRIPQTHQHLFIAPDDLVRDANGAIVGCVGFKIS